jgi:hypothetical protein
MIDPDPQTRLAVSRSRLRLELQAWQRGQETPTNSTQQSWLDALRAEPGTRVLLDALHLWWARQSWHQTTATLIASLSQLLRPLAQRNPLMLVLGAAALGGALVLFKPWRWLSLSTIAAGLLPQLLPKLLELLRPLSWVDMLNSWLQAGTKAEH